MRTFSVSTLGCRANQADSEKVSQVMRAAGWRELPAGNKVDCAFVNTCTITAEADHKDLKLLKRRSREAHLVIAGGCSIRERGGINVSLAAGLKLPDNVRLWPSGNMEELGALLGEAGFELGELQPLDESQHRTRALIRVQDGCDHFCSYCIVPYVRGRQRSFPVEELVRQVKRLETAGFKEIVLTGIHIAKWGRELNPQRDLAYLLRCFLENTERVRFRLSSVEPIAFPKELIALMGEYPQRVCPHLHLPLQHASDKILKRMRRDYTLAEYDALVQDFLQVPGAVLTTDILLGFPGEDESDLEILHDYLERTPYYHLHVFPYSRRPGTAADTYKDQVPESLKKERVERVIAWGEEYKERVLAKFRGTQRPVLVERVVPGTGLVTGTADNYIAVDLPGDESLLGQIVVATVG